MLFYPIYYKILEYNYWSIKESNKSPAGGKPTAGTEAQSATSAQEQAEEEAAATKIQAVFRGHQTRQTMKQADNKQTAEPEPTREQLEAEFRADDAGKN